MTLDGRLALITGGSRGIGRTIAVDLARRGADVAFTYLRNEDAAKETVALVEAAWEVTDADQLQALDGWHLWTPGYAESRLKWRPTKPLTVLLLRAASLIEPFPLQPDEANGGCKSRIELLEEPPADDLIPALTDTAFDMRSAAVHEALGASAGVGA